MAGETVITVVGNLTADPELRTIGSGASVCSFTIASTPRTYNRQTGQFEDGQALFMRCSAWRDLANHCAQSLSKGMRVIAQGRLQQRSYQAQDGSNRTVFEMQVDEIGRRCATPPHRYSASRPVRAASPAAITATPGTPAAPAASAAMQAATTVVIPALAATPASVALRAHRPTRCPIRRPLPTRGATAATEATASPRSAAPPISVVATTSLSSDHPAHCIFNRS